MSTWCEVCKEWSIEEHRSCRELKRIAELETDNARLREALQYLADEKNYDQDEHGVFSVMKRPNWHPLSEYYVHLKSWIFAKAALEGGKESEK